MGVVNFRYFKSDALGIVGTYSSQVFGLSTVGRFSAVSRVVTVVVVVVLLLARIPVSVVTRRPCSIEIMLSR